MHMLVRAFSMGLTSAWSMHQGHAFMILPSTTHDATEPGIRLGRGHEKLEKASHNAKAEHMGAGSDAHLWTLGTAQTLDPSGRQASTEPQPRQGPESDKSLHRKDVFGGEGLLKSCNSRFT